jgi:hypothetical protein
MTKFSKNNQFIEDIKYKRPSLSEIIDAMTPEERKRNSEAIIKSVNQSVAEGKDPMQGIADGMEEATSRSIEAYIFVNNLTGRNKM